MAPINKPPSIDDLLERLAYGLDVTFLLSTVFLGIAFYDWVITLPAEWRKIWRAKRTNVIKWLYLFTRYWTLMTGVVTMVIYRVAWSDAACVRLVKLEAFLTVPLTISYQLILVWRCFAVWNRSKVVLGAFLAMLAAELIYLSIVSAHVDGLVLPEDRGPCVPSPYYHDTYIYGIMFFFVPLIVDCILTGVTMARCIKLWRDTRGSPILQIFVREGLIFFAVICSANIANGALILLPGEHADDTCFVLATCMLSGTLSCRMVLALRQEELPSSTPSIRCGQCGVALATTPSQGTSRPMLHPRPAGMPPPPVHAISLGSHSDESEKPGVQ